MKINELETLLRTGDIGADSRYKWGITGRDGKRYNWHQFGQQALVLPIYVFMRMEGYAFYLVNIAATALTAVLIMRILMLMGFKAMESALTALVFGAGTLAWFYASKTPHEHALAVFFIMAAVYFSMRYQMGQGRRYLYFCMLSIGVGFSVRYDVILAILPISLYLYTGRKEMPEKKYSLLTAALIGAAVMAPFAAFNLGINYVKFGDVFKTGLAETKPVKLFGIEFLPKGLIGAFLSPGRSVFLFSPVLLLFPFYVRRFKRMVDGRLFMLCMSMTVMYILYFCSHHAFDGDWCFGPRYFLVIIPFMVMPLASIFRGFKKKRALAKALAVIIVIVSILVQVVFVSSNGYLSNVIKFGVDDDSMPELSAKYTRDFGLPGSWKWLMSYFPLEYSQFFNQFKIFRYTALISWDSANIYPVADEIRASSAPFLLIYINMMRQYDFWWLQERSPLEGRAAFIPLLIAVTSMALMVRQLRRAD